MSEKDFVKNQEELYKNLQEKYEGNDLFGALEDIQLAICAVMEALERGEYEIVKKKK